MIKLTFDRPDGEIVVRNFTEADLDEVAALSYKVFGDGMALEYEHFKSQIELFSLGQICAEFNGKIIGNASSLVINLDDYGIEHNYDVISDDGYIKNHNPNGESLYGIEVGVDPDYRKMDVGRMLYEGRKEICKRLNLRNILIGGRMPFYHKYAEELSAEEYVKKVLKEEIYDPIVSFQARNGFEYEAVIPNYLPEDPESLKYASLLTWNNPHHNPENPVNEYKVAE